MGSEMCIRDRSSGACYFALKLKYKWGYDDSLDCFGIHGIGSGLGVILLVFFLRPAWIADQGEGWTQMGQLTTQLIGMAATVGLAAGGTLIICVIVEKTVGFRLPVEMEKGGMDHELHGEHGYGLLNLN